MRLFSLQNPRAILFSVCVPFLRPKAVLFVLCVSYSAFHCIGLNHWNKNTKKPRYAQSWQRCHRVHGHRCSLGNTSSNYQQQMCFCNFLFPGVGGVPKFWNKFYFSTIASFHVRSGGPRELWGLTQNSEWILTDYFGRISGRGTKADFDFCFWAWNQCTLNSYTICLSHLERFTSLGQSEIWRKIVGQTLSSRGGGGTHLILMQLICFGVVSRSWTFSLTGWSVGTLNSHTLHEILTFFVSRGLTRRPRRVWPPVLLHPGDPSNFLALISQ